MNMKKKKAIVSCLAVSMAMSIAGCGNSANTVTAGNDSSTTAQITKEETVVQNAENNADNNVETADVKQMTAPKYVFLFIGDGMSYPQIESTNYYLNALKNGTSMGNKSEGTVLAKTENELSFLGFPVVGSAQTYDSTSFCPDSASTATSISTGKKTYSGTINMDETGSVSYETVTEKLREQLGYKIGVISSVNLNHATPAAFYCHQASRSNYYDIGLELVNSGFDYFAGGGLIKPDGKEGNQANLYDLATNAGYKVCFTQQEASAVTSKDGKVILIDEHLADSDAMGYEIDREDSEYALADYVSKGIKCLYEENDAGFFMMVEGGKIDWACHANDAASTITDMKAFSDAVEEAVKFYNQHPDETLILVTGDHETGGMTIGYAGTNYDTFLQNLSNQKISFSEYDREYVASYKENRTSFEEVLTDVADLFGLVTEEAAGSEAEDGVTQDSADSHPTGVTSGKLIMTEYELGLLKNAYDKTMNPSEEEISQQEYVLYGTYEPLSVTITHILNNKSGISFTSYSHTGLPVAVFAMGSGEEQFEGYYDNTDIYFKMAAILGIK